MKVLVLGSGGQVGRALLAGAPPGADVRGVGRADCDIGDRGQIARAIQAASPDLIFNAAAYTAVDRAESEPAEAQRINGDAPGLIAAAAQAAGARVVHLSTDFVFDGLTSRPYRPDDAPRPLSVYGRTKLAGEIATLEADPEALVVRTAWVYDAHGANFLTTMLRRMKEQAEVRVVVDQIGTPTYAASLASALWKLAAGGAHGIHHFTDAGVASWYDFAVAIAEEGRRIGVLENEVAVAPVATDAYPTAARRPGMSVLEKGPTWDLIGAPPHWRANLRAALREIAEHA